MTQLCATRSMQPGRNAQTGINLSVRLDWNVIMHECISISLCALRPIEQEGAGLPVTSTFNNFQFGIASVASLSEEARHCLSAPEESR